MERGGRQRGGKEGGGLGRRNANAEVRRWSGDAEKRREEERIGEEGKRFELRRRHRGRRHRGIELGEGA